MVDSKIRCRNSPGWFASVFIMAAEIDLRHLLTGTDINSPSIEPFFQDTEKSLVWVWTLIWREAALSWYGWHRKMWQGREASYLLVTSIFFQRALDMAWSANVVLVTVLWSSIQGSLMVIALPGAFLLDAFHIQAGTVCARIRITY